jgi:hypothetical protein
LLSLLPPVTFFAAPALLTMPVTPNNCIDIDIDMIICPDKMADMEIHNQWSEMLVNVQLIGLIIVLIVVTIMLYVVHASEREDTEERYSPAKPWRVLPALDTVHGYMYSSYRSLAPGPRRNGYEDI